MVIPVNRFIFEISNTPLKNCIILLSRLYSTFVLFVYSTIKLNIFDYFITYGNHTKNVVTEMSFDCPIQHGSYSARETPLLP